MIVISVLSSRLCSRFAENKANKKRRSSDCGRDMIEPLQAAYFRVKACVAESCGAMCSRIRSNLQDSSQKTSRIVDDRWPGMVQWRVAA